MKNANGSLGIYTRAGQSDVQLGRDRLPAPTVDLAGYVRVEQSGRPRAWSPNMVDADPQGT
ncbi:hypothetical protein A2J03_24390 [Rhodococcus sp. EPR-157]|uniref:hypothetical protein n=1 Tax=Rhodococcus sp. EPR-157 TaxID=1813677 RepID=UPI0007BB6FE3|nr:hypothetical protein [Rhodococcus sp. EPR-157]KZF06533.1 hypothetical protein A2J03_24390 [Rhodococcus sp. EPR-157]